MQGTGKPHPLPAGTRKYKEKKGGTGGEGDHHVTAAPDFEWWELEEPSPDISGSHLACPLASFTSLWGQKERNWVSEKGNHQLVAV